MSGIATDRQQPVSETTPRFISGVGDFYGFQAENLILTRSEIPPNFSSQPVGRPGQVSDQHPSDFPSETLFPAALTATDTAGGISAAGWLSMLRSHPESCGKDSHETPCSFDGECLCCFTVERLLLARHVAWRSVRRLLWRLPDRRMCSRNGTHRLQQRRRDNSDRLPRGYSGTSCLLPVWTRTGRLSPAVAANHCDGFAADLSLRQSYLGLLVPPLETRSCGVVTVLNSRQCVSANRLCLLCASCACGMPPAAYLNNHRFCCSGRLKNRYGRHPSKYIPPTPEASQNLRIRLLHGRRPSARVSPLRVFKIGASRLTVYRLLASALFIQLFRRTLRVALWSPNQQNSPSVCGNGSRR